MVLVEPIFRHDVLGHKVEPRGAPQCFGRTDTNVQWRDRRAGPTMPLPTLMANGDTDEREREDDAGDDDTDTTQQADTGSMASHLRQSPIESDGS
jgi:hypothetical protein